MALFTNKTEATRTRLLASAAMLERSAPSAQPSTLPHRRPGRVLQAMIVEDSGPIRERLIEMLSWPGEMRVFAIAATEAEALAHAESPVDLAVVDLQLASGTGFAVIRRLREAHGQAPTIVVFTNHAIPALRIAAFEAGADYFLDKSKDAGDVTRIAADLVAGRTPQRGAPST